MSAFRAGNTNSAEIPDLSLPSFSLVVHTRTTLGNFPDVAAQTSECLTLNRNQRLARLPQSIGAGVCHRMRGVAAHGYPCPAGSFNLLTSVTVG